MADSPIPQDASVVRLTVTSEGSAIDDAIGVISVEITKELNRIPWARVVLLDGDLPTQTFPVSSSDTFAPGRTIEISAGYGGGGDEESIFKGIVVRHGTRIGLDGAARLEVECRDPVVASALGRKNALYTEKTDSDVISAILANYDVTASVDSTTIQRDEMVQYYCSDWDFVVARAEAAGMVVAVDGGTVSVTAPATGSAAVLTVTYGESLMEFQAEMDARTQLGSVAASAWDPKTQAVTTQEATPPSLNRQGNLTSSTLAQVASPSSYLLQTAAALDASTLTAWAEARQLKAGLARIRGRMRFQGHAAATPGVVIELTGVGDRFEGNVLVTGVTHRILDGRWTTDAQFGLSPEWITERPDVVAPAASGWTAGVEGLQIGVVKKLDASPDGEPKIQVTLPVLGLTDGVWARLATLHGTNGNGVFFIPEVGDEVVVGFLANDPSHPVVLGSLHSSNRAPPYELTAENYTKAIVTPQGLTIELDDENKVVTVLTPGGNSVVLDDANQSVTLTDQSDNSVTLGSDGISLSSSSDISITASGGITITATENLELQATGDLKGSGSNVSLSADVALTASGNASAELSASGQTSVKGAMIMLN